MTEQGGGKRRSRAGRWWVEDCRERSERGKEESEAGG